MKKVSYALVVLAATVLSGCDFKVEPQAYLSDILRLSDGQQINTPVTVQIETPGESSCREHSDTYRIAIDAGFENAVFQGCVSEGVENYAVYEAEAVIAYLGQDDDIAQFMQNKPATFLAAVDGEIGRAIHILNYDRAYGAIQQRLDDMDVRMHGDINDLDLILSVKVINDTGQPQEISTEDTFYDAEPVLYTKVFSLGHRRSANIMVSDVANAAVKSWNSVYVFNLVGAGQLAQRSGAPDPD